jgi:aspartate aminotransferase
MHSAPDRLSGRLQSLQPTAVNSVLAEVRQLQAQGKTLVSLMRGEPDFRTPEHICEAAIRSLRDGRTSYPDNRGEPALRSAIAAKLLRDNGLSYDMDREILVTTGATFGIYAALTTLLNEGDEVLLPDPVYDAYRSPIGLAGGVAKPVPARIASGRFELPLEALDRALTPRTRVLLLNSPWNPVGTVFRRSELTALGEFVIRHRLFLISDEIYEAILYDGREHVPPASLSAGLRDRTILVNSLSKTYSMTGWRVGYCAAPATVIGPMLLVLQQSSRGPATFLQDAAAVALSGPQECVREMREQYSLRRRTVREALSGVPAIHVLPPEGGFFAMVDARGLGISSNDIRRRLLNEFGVVVIHGAAYGACGEGTLRVSFASGGEKLSAGLERLRTGLAALAEGGATQ